MKRPAPLSETELARLRSRDRGTLAAVFKEANPVLVRVCAANGVDGTDAEDLIAQTWEVFFADLGRFEGRSALTTFLCGILFNKIREHRRARGRFVSEDDPEKIHARPFTEDGWWNEPPAPPDRLLELKDAGRLLADCLEGLTVPQRSAFLLREVDGEDAVTIGSVLDVTVEHLRVLLFRAKAKLRACLEGRGDVV